MLWQNRRGYNFSGLNPDWIHGLVVIAYLQVTSHLAGGFCCWWERPDQVPSIKTIGSLWNRLLTDKSRLSEGRNGSHLSFSYGVLSTQPPHGQNTGVLLLSSSSAPSPPRRHNWYVSGVVSGLDLLSALDEGALWIDGNVRWMPLGYLSGSVRRSTNESKERQAPGKIRWGDFIRGKPFSQRRGRCYSVSVCRLLANRAQRFTEVKLP